MQIAASVRSAAPGLPRRPSLAKMTSPLTFIQPNPSRTGGFSRLGRWSGERGGGTGGLRPARRRRWSRRRCGRCDDLGSGGRPDLDRDGPYGHAARHVWADLQAQQVLKRDPQYAKRLDRGTFIWPSAKESVVSITASQMACMLKAIDWGCVGSSADDRRSRWRAKSRGFPPTGRHQQSSRAAQPT